MTNLNIVFPKMTSLEHRQWAAFELRNIKIFKASLKEYNDEHNQLCLARSKHAFRFHMAKSRGVKLTTVFTKPAYSPGIDVFEGIKKKSTAQGEFDF